jgi:MoxR-like ATPase/tetratricopeptide (TPR) repeat protein
MLLTGTFLFIICFAVCLISVGYVATGETHRIDGEVRWSGEEVIFTESILVTKGSTLIVEDTIIMMNNSAPFPEISVHGTLIMNNSRVIPLDYGSENRFTFKVYGSCRLVGNEFDRANSLSFFTNDVLLSGNTIKESKADAIYLNGLDGSNITSRFNDNTIIDSDLSGFRLLNAKADLLNNVITRSKLDAIHLSGAVVSITSGGITSTGRHTIYLTGNSTLDVYPGTNLTDHSFEFGDDQSRVQIHDMNGIRILKRDTDDETDYLMIAILVGIVALSGLVGVHLFYQWNRDRTTSGKFGRPSLAIKENTQDGSVLPEYKKSEDVEAQVAFGDMAMSGGSFEAALKYYNDALEFTRTDNLLVRRGNVLEKMQHYQEAFDNYESAYKINPMNKDAIEGMWWLRDAIKNREDIPQDVEEKIYEFIREPEKRKGPVVKKPEPSTPTITTEASDEGLASGDGDGGEGISPRDEMSEGGGGARVGDGPSDGHEGEAEKTEPEGKPVRIVQKSAGPQMPGPVPPQIFPGGMAPAPFQGSDLGELFKERSQRSPEERPFAEDDPIHGGGPLNAGPDRSVRQKHEFGIGDPDLADRDGIEGRDSSEDDTEGPDEDTDIDGVEGTGEPDEEVHIPIYEDYLDPLSISRLHKSIDEIVDDFDIGNLYFEDKRLLLKQIATSLVSGKHIIFYGPPGTGKSSIARDICLSIGVNFALVTGTSDWSTFDTIGGYMLEDEGNLKFSPGLFLKSCQVDMTPINRWLIIDEINRADIDKAFGPMFSALAGDNVTLPHRIDGEQIEIIGKAKGDYRIQSNRFIIHPEWHILATMNTFDKTSLYEMSYAFMRRFSFISVQIPENIELAVDGLVDVWGMDVDEKMKKRVTILWKIINEYRKIGPAIVRDILRCTLETQDYTSAINMYVLPQFEGLEDRKLKRFKDTVIQQMSDVVDMNQLNIAMQDFFNTKL